MKYNIETLLKEKDNNNFLLFWGHQPSSDGTITASCLSQWWPSTFVVDKKEFKTAEHWMMAQKAELFNDEAIYNQILSTPSPKDVKELGRKIKNFDEGIWNSKREQVVVDGNLHKFSQDKKLKTYLLSTGTKILVEASPYDKIWGIGLKADDNRASNPVTWQGLNLLGFALMEVRDKLLNMDDH